MAPNHPNGENSRFEAEALVIRGRIDDVEREQAESKQRDEEYKRRSVEVQERMADLQGRMVVLTRVLAMCAIVTGGIAWWQISAAKRAAEAAERSAKVAESSLDYNDDSFWKTLTEMKAQSRAMRNSSNSANALVRATEQSFRRGNRAYIGVSDMIIVTPPGWKNEQPRISVGFNAFDIEIVNRGVTPARHITGWGAVRVVTTLLESDNPDYPISPKEKVLKVGRDLVSGDKDYLKPGWWINAIEYKQIMVLPPERYFMTFGVLEYRDIFDATHLTKFCVYYNVFQNDVGYCPAHNTVQ